MQVQCGLTVAIRNSRMILLRHIRSNGTSAAPSCVDQSLVKSKARQSQDRVQESSLEASATAELVKPTTTYRRRQKGNHCAQHRKAGRLVWPCATRFESRRVAYLTFSLKKGRPEKLQCPVAPARSVHSECWLLTERIGASSLQQSASGTSLARLILQHIHALAPCRSFDDTEAPPFSATRTSADSLQWLLPCNFM